MVSGLAVGGVGVGAKVDYFALQEDGPSPSSQPQHPAREGSSSQDTASPSEESRGHSPCGSPDVDTDSKLVSFL